MEKQYIYKFEQSEVKEIAGVAINVKRLANHMEVSPQRVRSISRKVLNKPRSGWNFDYQMIQDLIDSGLLNDQLKEGAIKAQEDIIQLSSKHDQ